MIDIKQYLLALKFKWIYKFFDDTFPSKQNKMSCSMRRTPPNGLLKWITVTKYSAREKLIRKHCLRHFGTSTSA